MKSRISEERCYLCGSYQHITRPGSVRDNSNIEIFECSDCSLVFLSTLDHLSEDHYEQSGMHDDGLFDIDEWLKETKTDDFRRFNFVKEKLTNKNLLDFGCGVGGFLGLAKSVANKVVGVELERRLKKSFKERALNVFPDLTTAQNENDRYNLITAFHVVEHLPNPINILKELALLLEDNGELIIEVPSSEDALLTLYNCKPFQKFTYWSQHLFLFNTKTLTELAKQAGLKVNWLKHIQRYTLSNHLYWLATGKPGGHKEWYFMENDLLNDQYEGQLAALGKTDTIIISLSQ
jgi:2-polyprenyl-3-methyl-5-hydroxy-6-metoxy-1,4-benzoquinol methylase